MLPNPELADYSLIFLGTAGAWSMGHSYAGAVVSPAYGSRFVRMYTGIFISGLFVIAGALATFLKILTSTIQLYAFALLGVAFAVGARINFIAAPLGSFVLQ